MLIEGGAARPPRRRCLIVLGAATVPPKPASDYIRALSCDDGLKRTVFDAGIWIGAPVLGLRPWRAARLAALKVPNPTSAKLPSFLTVLAMASTMPSTASLACDVVQSVALRTA